MQNSIGHAKTKLRISTFIRMLMTLLRSTVIATDLVLGTISTLQAASLSMPTPQKQVAGYYQYQAGNVQITALLDGTNFMSPTLFKDIPQQQVHDILKKYYADQEKGVQTSVNAFLVNTGKSVLVDSGAASCFGAHLGSVLTNLKAAGYRPEQVDTILLTHLHPDHVCGISKNGTANFPNATVYASQDEANYWLDAKQADKVPEAKRAGYLGTVEKIKAARHRIKRNNALKPISLATKSKALR